MNRVSSPRTERGHVPLRERCGSARAARAVSNLDMHAAQGVVDDDAQPGDGRTPTSQQYQNTRNNRAGTALGLRWSWLATNQRWWRKLHVSTSIHGDWPEMGRCRPNSMRFRF